MMKAHKYILSILAIVFSQLLYASPDRLPYTQHTPLDGLWEALMIIIGLLLSVTFLWAMLTNKRKGKKTDGEDKTMIWLCILVIIGAILVVITKCS